MAEPNIIHRSTFFLQRLIRQDAWERNVVITSVTVSKWTVQTLKMDVQDVLDAKPVPRLADTGFVATLWTCAVIARRDLSDDIALYKESDGKEGRMCLVCGDRRDGQSLDECQSPSCIVRFVLES